MGGGAVGACMACMGWGGGCWGDKLELGTRAKSRRSCARASLQISGGWLNIGGPAQGLPYKFREGG